MLDGQACDARHTCLAIATPLDVSERVIRCTASFCLCAPGDACAQFHLLHARLLLALAWPFLPSSSVCCFANFWNIALVAPAVWPRVGVDDAQMCPLRSGARTFPFLMCSCFTSLAPRCSQCLLELCSTLSLLIAALARLFPFCSGWGMVFRLVPCCVALWSAALCFRFPLFGSFHQHFVPLGLTRLTFDDCIVVLVTDGLMPQGARVTKKCRREAAGPSEQPQGRERPCPPTRRAFPEAMPARAGRPLRKSSL